MESTQDFRHTSKGSDLFCSFGHGPLQPQRRLRRRNAVVGQGDWRGVAVRRRGPALGRDEVVGTSLTAPKRLANTDKRIPKIRLSFTPAAPASRALAISPASTC